MDWKTVKKIDAHVHLVPPETLEWIDGVWKQADPYVYLELMEKYHIEKALIVPINEGPTYYQDCSRTNQWLGSMMDHSDGTFIISHMGGCRWQDALEGSEYVDISTFLPELVRIYGIPMANRILREFGANRLIFATDYPQVHGVEPQDIYETYCDILNQMDFTDEEIERIAFRNISEILGLPE